MSFHLQLIDGEEVYFITNNGIRFEIAEGAQLFKPFMKLDGIESSSGTGILSDRQGPESYTRNGIMPLTECYRSISDFARNMFRGLSLLWSINRSCTVPGKSSPGSSRGTHQASRPRKQWIRQAKSPSTRRSLPSADRHELSSPIFSWSLDRILHASMKTLCVRLLCHDLTGKT